MFHAARFWFKLSLFTIVVVREMFVISGFRAVDVQHVSIKHIFLCNMIIYHSDILNDIINFCLFSEKD